MSAQLKIVWFLLLLLLFSCTQKPALVTLIVEAPDQTDFITVAANLPELGNWNPELILMKQTVEGHFELTFPALLYDTIEYKFTRGSWATEALDSSGNIPRNHRYIVNGDTTIYHEISDWKDSFARKDTGITGMVSYHRNFYSPQLDNQRDIIVWLPPSYSTDNLAHYPVLYMHDGQNIIDPFTSFVGQDWQMDETATQMIKSGTINKIIIVGISYTNDRTPEYSPVLSGQQYSAFIINTLKPFINTLKPFINTLKPFINTLKPFIDTEYRTKPEPEFTATMGSSMVGIISFHLAWDYPHVFGMAGCLSPAFLVDELEIVRRVASYTGANISLLFYIDNGTVGLEQKLQPAIDEMILSLEQAGFEAGTSLIYLIAQDAEHNEAAWAKRVAVPLRFFFGKDN